ncbi:MAG: AAA family ATPase [Elusimicrobiota bacterium]|jgi:MoxR-like ATPase/uncharacterized protein with von Willebrand factor type A (vWA) domain
MNHLPRRIMAVSVVVSFFISIPGLDCWAALGKAVSIPKNVGTNINGGVPIKTLPSALPLASRSLGQASLPGSTNLPRIPSMVPGATPLSPIGMPAQAQVPAPAQALPSAQSQVRSAVEAMAATAPGADENRSDEQRWAGGNQTFDGAGALRKTADAVAPDALPVISADKDLRLDNSDNDSASKFTADFHDKVSSKFAVYEFTLRDYYAWAKYIRFNTPKYGIKEAIRRGAAYVYGDRIEVDQEAKDFTDLLANEIKGLNLSQPQHGKDAAKAKELNQLAEPAAQTLAADEDSPFQIPITALVPDQANTKLILTPTTLQRIEAASDAFAMRDFALLLGPPATQKSAVPKYLAAQLGIPHLAVTMHPGIGTFELVGGYRPKVVRFENIEEAKRIISAKLKECEAAHDYADLIESAVKVYGAGNLEATLAAVEADLAAPASPELRRRLLTLGHGIEFGAASLAWQDGYLTYALKRDIWITFEEINAAPTESQEFLNEFMRSRRLTVSQKLGEAEILSPRPGGRFMLWATMNPETDPNREVLAKTLKNRWRVKYFGALPTTEQAEIIERLYELPSNMALALVENVHKELHRQAVNRMIGDEWRDGYEINLRQLMRVARRWKYFVEQETQRTGQRPDEGRQRFLLGREALSIYGGMMRNENERVGLFRILDQALRLGSVGAKDIADLRTQPEKIEDVGDSIRIGDVVLAKGQGGEFVPKPNGDYLPDAKTLTRLYEYAKALALGEPLLVMGESAAGKTTDLEYLFFRLNKNLRYKNLDSDTAIEEVVGGYAPGQRRGEFSYREGILPAAMEEKTGLFIDEFNLNPLVEWLNTVTDDGKLYLPHRIVHGKPMLVAAANPPDPRYPGRILLSPATRSRYTEIWADSDTSISRLKSLMSHWLNGGTIYGMTLLGAAMHAVQAWSGTSAAWGMNAVESSPSFMSGLFSRAKDWFSKKKASDPAAGEESEELDAPKSLEDLLQDHKIPEAQWPQYRSKVDRIQTTMRMVGSSIGRDTRLKWSPGNMWAYFPELNVATYPFDDLVTHSEEELIGVIDHESLHREITTLEERFPLARKYIEDPVKHYLWNGLEDPRVNSRGIHRLPGAQRYIHALYDRYFPKDFKAAAPNVNMDGQSPLKGDGGKNFNPQTLRYPHIEFVMSAIYYWRHGQPPTDFHNKSAKEAFEKAKSDIDDIFGMYPKGNEPTQDEKLAYTLEALKRIDEKILPLYEPLVKESEKQMAKDMKNSKGKQGQGQGQGKQGGGGMPNTPQPPKDSKPPKDQKDNNKDKKDQKGEGPGKDDQAQPDKKKDKAGSGKGKEDQAKKDQKKAGGKEGKDAQATQDEDGDESTEEPSKEDLAQARRNLEDHAREAAKQMGGKIKDNPKRPRNAADKSSDPKNKSDAQDAKKTSQEPGNDKPQPLSLEDIAQTQRDQYLERNPSPYQKSFEQVAHVAQAMVTHLENIFQKNSRPKDLGWYRSGKKPDVKQFMKRQGEGGVRDDYMLRRSQPSKRKYKVTVLLDESGSMDRYKTEAINSVVLLIDSLTRLQIDVEVIGFGEKATVHKSFKDPFTTQTKDRLIAELQSSLGAMGGTHDADALKLALDRISQQDGDRKLVFVVTDGDGNGPSKLADSLKLADIAGIQVMGVGVGAGMGYVKTAYPNHAVVDNIDDLPKTLKAQLEEYIYGQEGAASKHPRRRAQAFLGGTSAPGSNAMPAAHAYWKSHPWLWLLRYMPFGNKKYGVMNWRMRKAVLPAAQPLSADAIRLTEALLDDKDSRAAAFAELRGNARLRHEMIPVFKAVLRYHGADILSMNHALFGSVRDFKREVMDITGWLDYGLALDVLLTPGGWPASDELTQHRERLLEKTNDILEILAERASRARIAEAEAVEKQPEQIALPWRVPSAVEDLPGKVRSAIKELAQDDSLTARLRRAALEEALRDWETASDSQAVANQRLRAQLSSVDKTAP